MLRKNRQLLVILSIFIVFLWANGHQKGASLPLLGAECTSGMLNGDAPEYAPDWDLISRPELKGESMRRKK